MTKANPDVERFKKLAALKERLSRYDPPSPYAVYDALTELIQITLEEMEDNMRLRASLLSRGERDGE